MNNESQCIRANKIHYYLSSIWGILKYLTEEELEKESKHKNFSWLVGLSPVSFCN